MLHGRLNLGILAHVDAGKTTLTERLLFDAGVTGALGSVDRGTTQTDTLALERTRGITIRAAVVSFPLDGLDVNLIDTPGHPDFIAEVERSLVVLDGAVLVISAVEGVQAQTLVLMRALERLAIPTLLFINKTDRRGADVPRVFGEIRRRLTSAAVAVWALDPAELADLDDELLARYVDGEQFDPAAALASLTRRVRAYPTLAGSALSGDGAAELRSAIKTLLPVAAGEPDAPVAATVFKIDRGSAGEKHAYVRLFAGTIRIRDRFDNEKVTMLEAFDHGGAVPRSAAVAGEIARLSGLHSIRIGDRLGGDGAPVVRQQFPPPTLRTVVEPRDPGDGAALRLALEQLAEQDPLIGVRQDGSQISVSIYGEVQKEVIEATLAGDYQLDVAFRETQPILVERLIAAGEAAELLNAPTNPFHAQIGLRAEPGQDDAGVAFRLDVPHDRIPLYVYKRRENFEDAMAGYVRDALQHGPHGWQVIDCTVTMTDSWYSLADGPPSRRGPMPTAADFRGLTPIVLAQAIERAGTVVCEPLLHLRLIVPAWSIGPMIAAAARLDATLDTPAPNADTAIVEGTIAAARVEQLRRQMPALTRGEGTLESSFAGYRPVVPRHDGRGDAAV